MYFLVDTNYRLKITSVFTAILPVTSTDFLALINFVRQM